MVSLKWCCNQKSGIQLIEPNENLSNGYLIMAENALGTMNREKDKNLQFSISACYYSMYYSFYAILMKVGIKCEIHSCTLEIMDRLLKDFYSQDDLKLINKAFDVRNLAQYYVDKIIAKDDIDYIMSNAPYFCNKSREIVGKLNEKKIKEIRKEIEVIVNKK
jgi:uncharacterized protein (UPF0332 family)